MFHFLHFYACSSIQFYLEWAANVFRIWKKTRQTEHFSKIITRTAGHSFIFLFCSITSYITWHDDVSFISICQRSNWKLQCDRHWLKAKRDKLSNLISYGYIIIFLNYNKINNQRKSMLCQTVFWMLLKRRRDFSNLHTWHELFCFDPVKTILQDSDREPYKSQCLLRILQVRCFVFLKRIISWLRD